MKASVLCLLISLAAALPAAAQDWAVGGFDPVGYAQAGRPTPGRSDIATMWKGQLWHFASEENRARFRAISRWWRAGCTCWNQVPRNGACPATPPGSWQRLSAYGADAGDTRITNA